MAQYRAAGLGANTAFMQAFGNTTTELDIVTQTVNLVITDTVDLVRVAGGTKLVELLIWNGDLDTGATLQFSLGYRPANSGGVLVASTTYFAAAGQTTWQSAVLGSAPTRYAFVPIDFNEDVYITATITASAAGIAASPTITTLARGISRGIK